ncbi:hypothetical protein A3F03_03275 [Candidatus Roizmanbacteria bacterium RIFCSPHIGHO2_12_FULL_41_11]|uniref:Gas vesicle protein n=2 Tax=Candidatus Roizmaniibacteriota TaxID=1752723 RepID=A0A1F7J6Z7_9BACT|nr:MAG: hypothetical protein A3F03_03275 [Candidatus Roizmanbacteria bacterium RIFCSPHIGHO2_12_FULL_41_11]OGK51383.1 MAG: hypothetical protein A2966_00005 [Candidatus Roizmanbacteria bacterium RIFCSPLOWO2_01_FULL_41_22]
MADKKSNFGLGVMLGTIIGGLTAFFLSPKSGPENREMAKAKIAALKKTLEEHKVPEKLQEIYGEVTDEGKKAFLIAKKELEKKLSQLEESFANMDKEKYLKLVDEAMKKVKEQTKETAERINRLRAYFADRFN